MKKLIEMFFGKRENSQSVSSKTRSHNRGRHLLFEPLEERQLLAVSPAEFDAIKVAYSALKLGAYDDYNIIEVGVANPDNVSSFEFSEAGIKAAIAKAATTTKADKDDLIVVRTTATQNKITLSGSELGININASTHGSVTIVSLDEKLTGDEKLTISANTDVGKNSRVFNITNSNSDVTFAGLTITGGNITGSNNNGAGILYSGNLTITDCIITGNTTAYYGGGLYTNSSSAVLTVTGKSEITHNKARNGGGIDACGTIEMANCTISNNEADYYGGGIYCFENSTILRITDNTTISNNETKTYSSTSTGYGGGGIYIANGTVEISNSKIWDNTSADTGGGILINAGTVSILSKSEIRDNKSGFSGAGIWQNSGSGLLTVTECEFSGNEIHDHTASGAAIHSSSQLIVDKSSFTKNISTNYGGAVCVHGKATITNSQFIENEATVSGGAIHVGENSNTVATITDCVFQKNLASKENGGAIFINLSGTATIVGCTITENKTLGTGSSNGRGGGIYSEATLYLINSTVAGNTALNGGGIYNSSSSRTATIINSTITENTATTTGGGIYNNSGTLTLYNTIVASQKSGHDIYRYGGTVQGSNNLIGDGTGQTSLEHGKNGNIVGMEESPFASKKIKEIEILNGLKMEMIYFTLLDDSLAVDGGDTERYIAAIATMRGIRRC